VAVNPGTLASHTKWAEEFGFQFPIAVDKDKKVAAAYGAVNMLGNIKRTVVVVDKQGKVAWIKEGMPETAEILSFMKG
jgi:thioredoxin-dependent peroxiredoxin